MEMRKHWTRFLTALLALAMLTSGLALAEGTVEDFATPDIKYEPGVRWELPLGNTTDEELIRELNSLHDAGFGVVEITATGQPEGTIPEGYPHAGENYAAVYGMGSYEWSRTLQTILRTANELGMRVDYHVSVNNGSNKHVPGISPNDAAASKELVSAAAPVAEGALPELTAITPEAKTFISNVDGSEQALEQHLYAALLVNVVEKGKTIEMLKTLDGSVEEGGGYGKETFTATYDVLDFDSTVDVTALYQEGADAAAVEAAQAAVDAVDLSAGNWEVIGFWWRGDCTTIGGVTEYPSYKIDYFSMDGTNALMDYYKNEIFRFGQEGFEDMEELVAANGGNIFADSYGANANWANELPAKFEEVTGESITRYLPALIYAAGNGRGGDKTFGYSFTDGSEESIKATIMECMTQLLIENQLDPMCEMCAEIGLEYRDQVVYATSRLDMIAAAAHVDIPEGESLNMVDSPDYFTAMASASHLLDKDIVSTEHGATFGATMGAYAYTNEMAIRQANRVIPGGVNQYIMHYYTYNDLDYPDTPEALWPGFSAMGSFFSEPWRDNSPTWENVDIMTNYLARVGYFMRQGLVKRDVVVYKQSYWYPRHVRLFWVDEALQDAGYTYDFISDGLLGYDEAVVTDGVLAADTAGYKALIFDAQGQRDAQDIPIDKISLVAIEKFVEYAEAGLPIIMVGSYPTGLFEISSEDDQARFEAALATLQSLDNVVLVETEADVPAALKALGVTPDAENLEPTRVTSYHTQDEGIDYYYLYNQSNNYFEEMDVEFTSSVTHYGNTMDEGYDISTQVALEGEGVPYLFDLYTGEVSRIAEYSVDEEGRIVLDIDLVKDQSMLVAIAPADLLDDGLAGAAYGTADEADLLYEDGALTLRATQSGDYTATLSDGSEQTVTAEVPEAGTLSPWSLTITSYVNKNDISAAGVAASEIAYDTISGITLDSLQSWLDIGTVTATVTKEDGTSAEQEVDLGSLSGIGTYTATLTLPEDWAQGDGMYIDLGDPYDMVVVYVNGTQIPTVDQVSLVADIGEYLQAGENEIVIETNTTFSNALVTLRSDWYGTAKVNAYGLREDVTFIPYVDVALN